LALDLGGTKLAAAYLMITATFFLKQLTLLIKSTEQQLVNLFFKQQVSY
jgi:hypothetical protein